MSHDRSGSITALLAQFRGGQQADAALMSQVYDELHRLAAHYMRQERGNHTLQPTALVHEAYMRLTAQRAKAWKNRAHFFAVAALLMRQILVDSARHRLAAKRGDGSPHISLDDAAADMPVLKLDAVQSEDLLAIDEALTALAAIHPRQSRVVELKFFAGMSAKDIASALDISERSVDRDWATAQEWLYARLRPK
jgi:RNA polymerase sigma factor (TIGR02999 family)